MRSAHNARPGTGAMAFKLDPVTVVFTFALGAPGGVDEPADSEGLEAALDRLADATQTHDA